MASNGRPANRPNLTNKEVLMLTQKYIEIGNWADTAKETGYNVRTLAKRVKEFINKNPEEFQKMLDAFLARNKMEMIHQNAHTTQKALKKVDELLDNAGSLKEAAMAYGILYDKGALMKGEATSNSAVVIKMAGDIQELAK